MIFYLYRMLLRQHLFCLLMFFIVPTALLSQNEVEALKKKLEASPDDTSRIQALSALVDAISDNNVWPEYNQQMLELAEDNIAGAKGKELKIFQKAKADALNNIGYLYKTKGDIANALKYYSMSLQIREKMGDKQGIAVSYINLAVIYEIQQDTSNALNYYNKCFEISSKIHDSTLMAGALHNKGYLLHLNKDYINALMYYNQSLYIYEKLHDDERISHVLNNIGDLYVYIEQYSSSLRYLKRAYAIQKNHDFKHEIIYSSAAMSRVFNKLQMPDSALYFALISYNLSKELGNPEDMKYSSKLLSELYASLGNYKDAYEFYKTYKMMNDSILNIQNQEATYKQKISYEYEKKELAHAEKVKQQKIIIWSGSIGLVLIIIFSVSLFKRFRITQRQKLVIEEQHKSISDSIRYAKTIQTAILPSADKINASFPDAFILYKPKDVVSGDFYWFHDMVDRILLAAVDCTGHGVPGAFMSVVGSNLLNQIASLAPMTNPDYILSELNDSVSIALHQRQENSESKDGMDAAIVRINKQKNTIDFAGAMRPLFLVNKTNGLTEIKGDRISVGGAGSGKLRKFKRHTIPYEKGDAIYLCSDGFADQFGGEKNKKFTSRALKELLLSISQHEMKEQKTLIEEAFNKWKGNNEQVDDLLVIGVRL